MHIIVDPSTYSKPEAFKLAIELVNEFLTLNNLAKPSSIIDCSTFAQARYGTLKTDYGFYESVPKRVNVNVKKTRTPVKVPGFQWSFTGFKADLTAPGVTAHEAGHHVHTILGDSYSGSKSSLVKDFCEVSKSQPEVSSYEPNRYESWAESMRLFILNPSLLSEGRPLRYNYFIQNVGLKPIVDIHWKEVLVNAHERIIKAAENWCLKK